MTAAPRLCGLDNMPDDWRGAVIAIGNFDGVHRGHQAVLSAARAAAEHHEAPLLAMTFEPHPRTFFAPGKPVFRLTPAPAKAVRLNVEGVHGTLVLPFDSGLAAMSAEDFVRDIMIGRLAIRHAVTGYDFHFGHKRQGTPDYLVRAGVRHDFGVTLVGKHGDGEGAISSSRVRACLADGDIAGAGKLLGWDWSVIASVVAGDRRGRELGFPTANMALNPACRLAHGIYTVRYQRRNGDTYDGVASFGRRPTFDNGAPLLETFLFDFDGDLYGEPGLVTFVSWLRPERKFDRIDELVEQMKHDAEQARILLDRSDVGRGSQALAGWQESLQQAVDGGFL